MPGKYTKRGRPWRNRFAPSLTEDYSADEKEFLIAMDRFKREKRIPFPTLAEILSVVRSLGYSKAPKESQ